MDGYIPFAMHWTDCLWPDCLDRRKYPDDLELTTRVVGVGAKGGACLELIFESQLRFVDLLAVDHDPQRLAALSVPNKVCLAGTESQEGWEQVKIKSFWESPPIDLLIIVTSLEDAADVQCAVRIAQIATERHVSVFAFVIKSKADAQADMAQLRDAVTSLFLIDKAKLEPTSAGQDCDELIRYLVLDAVSSLFCSTEVDGELINRHVDILPVVRIRGDGRFGQGMGQGDNFAVEAVRCAIHALALEPAEIKSAKGLLINCRISSNFFSVHHFGDTWEQMHCELLPYINEEANCQYAFMFDDNLAEDQMVVMLFVIGLAEPVTA